MRLNEKWKDKYEWHQWFAWYPIWIHTGHCKGTWVFWEKVERKKALNACGDGVTYIRNIDGSDIA